MKRIAFVFLVSVIPNIAFAKVQGQALLDSLQKVLPSVTRDSARLRLLDDLSFHCRTVNPDEGLKYATEEMALAEKMKWDTYVGLTNLNIGLNYQYKSDYTNALLYFYKGLTIFDELHDTLHIGAAVSDIGVIYQAQANYDKALEYNLKSLKINEELKLKGGMAGDFGNISNIYLAMSDNQKALEYALQSLKLFEQLKDTSGIANNLGNIANIFQAQKQFSKALAYNIDALAFFEHLGNKSGIANTLGNTGAVYKEIGNCTKAIEYLSRAIEISKEIDDIGGIGIWTGLLGEVYYKIGADSHSAGLRLREGGGDGGDTETSVKAIPDSLINLSQVIILNRAIQCLDKGIEVCKESDLNLTIEFSKCLSETYMQLGDYKKALESYKQYTAFKDSLFSSETKVKIANLETQRALDLKDKQILIDKLEVAKKRNERILFIVSIALLLLVIGIGLRKLSEQIQSNRQLAKERKKHLARIEAQTSMMKDIASIQSHEVGGQVATILGLAQLFNAEDFSDPTNKVIVEGIAEVAGKLDVIVKDLVKKENNLNNQ